MYGCSKQMSSPAASALGNSNSTQTASADQAAPFAGKKSSPTSADKAIGASLVPEQVVIPSGTAITVRLQNAVSSATSTPGDQFEATLDQPIMVDGQTIAPEGAHVTGRVVAARRSGRLMHSGYLRIALSSLTLDGKSIPVQSSSVMVAGMSHKKRNLAWIGGGAGGGALTLAVTPSATLDVFRGAPSPPAPRSERRRGCSAAVPGGRRGARRAPPAALAKPLKIFSFSRKGPARRGLRPRTEVA